MIIISIVLRANKLSNKIKEEKKNPQSGKLSSVCVCMCVGLWQKWENFIEYEIDFKHSHKI